MDNWVSKKCIWSHAKFIYFISAYFFELHVSTILFSWVSISILGSHPPAICYLDISDSNSASPTFPMFSPRQPTCIHSPFFPSAQQHIWPVPLISSQTVPVGIFASALTSANFWLLLTLNLLNFLRHRNGGILNDNESYRMDFAIAFTITAGSILWDAI